MYNVLTLNYNSRTYFYFAAFAIPSKLSDVRGLNQIPEAKENSYGVVGGKSTDITNYPYTVRQHYYLL